MWQRLQRPCIWTRTAKPCLWAFVEVVGLDKPKCSSSSCKTSSNSEILPGQCSETKNATAIICRTETCWNYVTHRALNGRDYQKTQYKTKTIRIPALQSIIELAPSNSLADVFRWRVDDIGTHNIVCSTFSGCKGRAGRRKGKVAASELQYRRDLCRIWISHDIWWWYAIKIS